MAANTQSFGAASSVWGELQGGLPPGRDLALRLINCDDDDLPSLLAAAAALRDRIHGRAITYSPKVFLPLTNLCRCYCRYCTFRRDPGEAGAHTMSPDEVLEVATEGEKLGCTEALFSLGDKPEAAFPEARDELRRLGYSSTLAYVEAMCELVLRHTSLLPHVNAGVLTRQWTERLARVSPSLGLMLETTSDALLAPGGAHDTAPDKIPSVRLRCIAAAGESNVPFTTGLLVGIGETVENRVDTLLAIAALHQRYGHIQEIIVQNFCAKAGTPMAHSPEPSRAEMLRTIAVTRLLLPRMNIQAPPNLSSPDVAVLISAGINDWGGVSPLTPDFINPEAPWPHVCELEAKTNTAGFELRRRLCVYPEFVPAAMRHGGIMAKRLRAAVEANRCAAAWQQPSRDA